MQNCVTKVYHKVRFWHILDNQLMSIIDNKSAFKAKKGQLRPKLCAREESNLHGNNLPLGPQPSASTSSATCA
jgi:hypothetical protein